LTAGRGNIELFQKLSECAKENLTTEEINNKLLLATDNEGRTVWQLAAGRDNIQLLQKLWECAKENLKREVINNNVLLATDNERLSTCTWQLCGAL